MIDVIAYPRCDLSETKLVKGDPEGKRCMNEASHAPCSNVSQKYAHASHVVSFPYDQVLFHRYRRHSNSEGSSPDEYKVISHKDPSRPYYLPIQRSTQKTCGYFTGDTLHQQSHAYWHSVDGISCILTKILLKLHASVMKRCFHIHSKMTITMECRRYASCTAMFRNYFYRILLYMFSLFLIAHNCAISMIIVLMVWCW